MISERAAKALLKATSENREHSIAAIKAFKDVCEAWCTWYAKELERGMEGNTRVKPQDVRDAYTLFWMNRWDLK